MPYGDAMYYKHRPTIGIKEKDVLKIDAHFGWQKSMARHEEPVRRGQGGDRAGRGLRPAVVLALHVDLVLAHRGARTAATNTAGSGGPRRRWIRPGARANMIVNISDSQTPGGEGGEARAARVHRPGEVPARGVCAGEGGARCAGRADRAGRRRAQVRAGSHQERGAGLRSGARRVEQVQGERQPGSASARPGQGGGAHRGGLPDEAVLRAAAQQPVRHAREPGGAARSAAASTARTPSRASSRR